MPNTYFQFKQFTVQQHRCAMKVTTDGCLFGAWVASQLSQLQPKTILDVGAGTGLLSLMAAQQSPALIDAVEIDAAAAAQAGENVAASPWAERIQIITEDVLGFAPARQYDCIISNPPFYENDLASPNKGRSVAHHDAGLKLADLLCQVGKLLIDGGTFFLLLPARRKEEALASFSAAEWYLHHLINVQSSPSHPPFRIMLKLARSLPAVATESTFLIRTANGEYHPELTRLLKAYYLHL